MQSWGLEPFAEKVQIIFTSAYVNFVVLLTPKEKYLLAGAENTHLTKASLKVKHLKFEPLSSQLLPCQGCVLHNLEFKFLNFRFSQLLSVSIVEIVPHTGLQVGLFGLSSAYCDFQSVRYCQNLSIIIKPISCPVEAVCIYVYLFYYADCFC